MKTTSILFAIGNRIYFYDPESSDPIRQVAERPALVTSLLFRCGLKKADRDNVFLDSCYDGGVRKNLTDEAEIWSDDPITGVINIRGLDNRNVKLLDRSLEGNPYELLLLTTIGVGGTAFKKPCGETIASQTVNAWAHALPTNSNVCWSANGRVYRGLGMEAIDRAYTTDRALIVAHENTFLVCHFGNDATHPEGVVLSTRDHRTVLTWDPAEYGYCQRGGIFQKDDKFYFLFVSSQPGKKGLNVQGVYTMPLRHYPDCSPLPTLIGEFKVPDCPPNNFLLSAQVNPFCAADRSLLNPLVNSLG